MKFYVSALVGIIKVTPYIGMCVLDKNNPSPMSGHQKETYQVTYLQKYPSGNDTLNYENDTS